MLPHAFVDAETAVQFQLYSLIDCLVNVGERGALYTVLMF